MENKLILEIKRINNLMGLNESVNPWAWVDNVVGAFDNFTSTLSKFRTKGVPMTDSEIDNFVAALKKSGNISEDEAKELLLLFKNNNAIRRILNTTDDFLSEMKKVYKDYEPPSIAVMKKLAALTKDQMDLIMKDVLESVQTKIRTVGTKFNNYYNTFVNNFTTTIQNIINKEEVINSVDDIYNLIDDNISAWLQKDVNDGITSLEKAETYYEVFSKELRNSPEIAAKVEELKVAGLLESNPPKTQRPSKVSGYTPKNNELNDLLGSAKVKNADGTVKVKKDQVDKYLANELDKSKWGPMLDNSGKLSSKWSDNFFFRYCKMGFCEVIIDFVRSFRRSPEDFVKDTTDTLNKIDELFKKYSTMDSGDAGRASLKKELDGYVNRLKSDSKMLQTKTTGFETTWNMVEANIRKTLKEGNDSSYADKFINYIKNEAITSGGETIGEFIDLMKTYYVKKSGSKELLNLFEMFTPEFRKNWMETRGYKYVEEVIDVWKKNPENGAFFGRLAKTLGKVLWDITWNGFKRSLNFLTIGTFRYYKDILKRLKTGKFTNWGGLKNYGLLYIELVIITNVMDPIYELIGNLWDSYKEIKMIGGDTGSEEDPFEQFKSNFASKINIFGTEFDWVPFYNPIPGTDGTHLGLKPAPLPNYLKDRFMRLIDGFITVGTTDTTGDVVEARKSEILKQITSQVDEMNNTLQTEWDSATPEEKEKIKEKNGYYEDYYDILKYTYDDEIEPAYLKMILDSLEYNPRISSDTVLKMVDLKSGDFSKLTEYNKLLKDSKTAISDVKGYMTIKDKYGKKYRIIMKPSDDELYYNEPSMDVMEKNPKTEITRKNIKEFVNKLK